MPGLDKSGPLGQGSQTGRKMGRCAQENDSIIDEMPRGRGRGLGRGMGRKMRLGNGRNAPGDGYGFGRGRGRRQR